ncbi:MAG: hypothetical protein ABIF10_03450 [Candidatus Woesearchaeota archaeon]
MSFYQVLKKTVLGIDARVLRASLYDLLFYASSFAVLAVWNRLVMKRYLAAQLNFADMTPGLVSVAAKSAQDFLIFIILSFIFFVIIFVLAYSLFRGQMWLSLLKRKMNWTFYWKYSLFNLAWYAGWTLILIAGLLVLKPGASVALLVLAILLMIHFGWVINIEFAKKPGMPAVISGFSKALSMRKFILPYVMILLGYLIVLVFGKLLEIFPVKLDYGLFAIFVAVAIVYTGCARLYIINIVR